MKINTKNLDGIKLSALPRPDTDLVVAKLSFRHNLPHSPQEYVLLTLYADLLLSGTEHKDRSRLTTALNEAGIDIAISSGEGTLSLTITFLKAELKTALKLINEILRESTFTSSEHKRAKITLKNSLVLIKDDARRLAHDLLTRELFQSTSPVYNFLPEEFEPLIDSIKSKEIEDLHLTILHSEYIVTLGGEADVITSLQELMCRLRTTYPCTQREHLPQNQPRPIKSPRIIQREITSKQNLELSIGGAIPLRINDEDYAAFIFGLHVLGHWGGFAGRLMSTVREKEGLTYGIYAKAEGANLERSGYWRIMTFFAPKDTPQGLASTVREIRAIAQKGITDAEWKRFQNIIRTSEALLEDTFIGQLRLAHSNALAGLSPDAYLALKERLKTVKRSQVNQALKKYLLVEEMVVAVTGPTTAIPVKLSSLIK